MIEKKPITFTIRNKYDKEVIVKAYTTNMAPYLYRGGALIKCSCGTPYEYKDNKNILTIEKNI